MQSKNAGSDPAFLVGRRTRLAGAENKRLFGALVLPSLCDQ